MTGRDCSLDQSLLCLSHLPQGSSHKVVVRFQKKLQCTLCVGRGGLPPPPCVWLYPGGRAMVISVSTEGCQWLYGEAVRRYVWGQGQFLGM